MNTENITKAEFAVLVLKEYSEEEHTLIRSTNDLSPLEEWLIVKLKQKQENLEFNARVNVNLIRRNHELASTKKNNDPHRQTAADGV